MPILYNRVLAISQYTVLDGLQASYVDFDIAAATRLVLTGAGAFNNVTAKISGQIRNVGLLTIDSLTLSGTGAFVNAGYVDDKLGVQLGALASDILAIRNLPGAVWTLGTNSALQGSAFSWFNNLGRLQVFQGAVAAISVTLIQRGVLAVDGYFGATGATRLFGAVTGAGSARFAKVDLINADLSIATWGADSARVIGHVVTSSAVLDVTQFTLVDGGVLNVSGYGAVLAEDATFAGHGKLSITGSAVVSDLTLTSGVSLDNSGSVSIAGGSVVAKLDGHGDVAIRNLAGASWTDGVGGAYFDTQGSGGSATFYNSGDYTSAFQSGTDFNLAVVNDGIFRETSAKGDYGKIVFERALSGHGAVEVGYGEVKVNAAVGAGQTFDFSTADAPALLRINDVQEFAGAISGFGRAGLFDNQIVVDTTKWACETYVAGVGGGSLMFTDGAHEIALRFVGDYKIDKFHLAVMNNMSTITYG